MDREEFERLIDTVASPHQLHPCGPTLPGRSPAMLSLAEQLKGVRAELGRPPVEQRCGVVFVHPPAPPWMGLELLRLCGVSPEATCELHQRSPVYNAGLLFGYLRLPGKFEAGGRGVVGVAGLEGLGVSQFERLRAHLEAWWQRRPAEAGHHLVMTAEEHPSILAAVSAAGAAVIRLAPLAERPEDFPHVLNAIARRYRGWLGDFDLAAFSLLAGHRWQGDLLELEGVVQRLYSGNGAGGLLVKAEPVRDVLRDGVAIGAHRENSTLWEQVQSECRACDEQTTELIGAAFFVAAANETDPFDDASPRGQFFRVISWAYQRFYEAAKTNLEFLWAARQVACPGDVTESKRLCGFINRFRHHQQHHTPAGRPGFADVQQWLSVVCGGELPAPWHHEMCVTALLVEILRLTAAIRRLLASVANENSAGRMLLVEQWQERLNLSWSPQRRREFICERLLAVAGWKVNPRPLADQWVEPVQEYLMRLRHLLEMERLEALTQWLDARLKSDPDSQPLVRGDDLVNLGIPPARRKDLLADLQRAQLQGLCQEELLQRARNAAG